MSTSADFLIGLAGRLHYLPEDARELLRIAAYLRRLETFADDTVRDAIHNARENETQIKANVAAELARICKGHGQ